MAWECPVLMLPGLIAGSSFATGNGYNSTGQFLFVKMSANDTVVPCSALTDIPLGVAQTNPASGDAIAVMVMGVSKVYVGAGGLTIDSDTFVGTDAQGKAVMKRPTSSGANYGNYVRGIALETANAGELGTILLIGPWTVH